MYWEGSPPKCPNLTSLLGLWCVDGQGAQPRFWHVCPHRQGVSHPRWLAHLPLGVGAGSSDAGLCGFGRPLSVGVWLLFQVPLSLHHPALPIKGLRTL